MTHTVIMHGGGNAVGGGARRLLMGHPELHRLWTLSNDLTLDAFLKDEDRRFTPSLAKIHEQVRVEACIMPSS